jgi:hypothetical protein
MCAVGVFGVPRVVRGIIIAPLQACFPFLIIMTPDRIFFLRNGMTCAYAPGTRLKVVYTENDDGVKDVVSIQAVSRKDPSRMPRGVTPGCVSHRPAGRHL